MTILTLSQLRAVGTQADYVTSTIAILEDLGFPAANWQAGSVPRTMVEIVASIARSAAQGVSALTYMVSVETATGDYLTELALSHYQITRSPAVAAQYSVPLLGGASGPPHTVAAGELVLTDGTRTYRNTAAATIAASATTTLTFEAEIPGADGSVTPSTLNALQTPLAGVSVTSGSVAETRAGVDEESDTALRARCRTQWATLSVETTASGLENRIRDAVSAVDRVVIDDSNPRGAGTANVYLADTTGAASSGDVTAVVAAIADEVFMADVGETSAASVWVQAATESAVAVTATVYFESSYTSGAVQTAVEAAIAAYINAAPIGGYDLSPGPSSVILRNDIVQAIESSEGVRSVVLTAPAADVVLTATQVATVGTLTITYTAITG